MPITLQCKNGHTLRLKDEAAGKKVRCPECQTVIVVDDDAGDSDFEPEAEPRHKRNHSRGNSSKKRQGKSRGKKKSSSGALVWVIAGGVSAGLLVIGAVLFLILRPAAPQTATAKPEESQPAVASSAPAAAAAERSKAPEPAARPDPSPPVKTETASAETAVAGKPPASQPAPDVTAPAASGSAPPSTGTAPSTAVKVWDTGGATASPTQNLTVRGKDWAGVVPDASQAHTFRGDCVIENEKIWLHIPQDPAQTVKIAAKDKNASQAVIPINILGTQSSASGPRICQVTDVSSDSVLVTFGAADGGPKVGCRVTQGKYWIEVLPQEGAEGLTIGTKAKFVVVPTEFGEDEICDADWALQGNMTSIRLPHENMVIALERDGNHMSILTYPSIDQAGELTVASEGAQGQNSSAIASSMSAKFNGNSVFVCLLPQKDLWYSEMITKKYSAPGHIPVTKPLYPGIWRIGARIVGKTGPLYYVSEFAHKELLFECRQSGTVQCFFYFLCRPEEGTASETLTPLDIYRETLGESEKNAYLLETEVATGRLCHGPVKYRGVCGCVDDMRDAWKTKPQTLATDPSYFTKQLHDCQTIMDQMDRRLHDYERMSAHIGEMIEAIDADTVAKDNTAAQTFLTVVRSNYKTLKSSKVVEVDRAYKLLEEIEQKIQTASSKKISLLTLDKQIEQVRDVANKQEDQLKKFRGIYLTLSKASSAIREQADDPLKQQVAAIGHDCRKMLRTRGRAE